VLPLLLKLGTFASAFIAVLCSSCISRREIAIAEPNVIFGYKPLLCSSEFF
jgi:hypothetical protein